MASKPKPGTGENEGNSLQAWTEMYDRCQSDALKTRLAIPLLYGVDAVHGHNNVLGVVVFPQNIGIVVAEEAPYAWMFGDRSGLTLATEDAAAIDHKKQHGIPVVLVLTSGRPLEKRSNPAGRCSITGWQRGWRARRSGCKAAPLHNRRLKDSPFPRVHRCKAAMCSLFPQGI